MQEEEIEEIKDDIESIKKQLKAFGIGGIIIFILLGIILAEIF